MPIIHQDKEFLFGYTPICEMDGAHSDMLMDFGILRLKSGQKFEEDQQLERAYILSKKPLPVKIL